MRVSEKIEKLKKQWGGRLCILGHYYQRDEVLRHADFTGDSLELARRAAAAGQAEKIVFCGVHFMAESACILAGERQAVYMPDPAAGCPMADMAPLREVLPAWTELNSAGGGWSPVAYVNSSAAVKAFCGEHDAATCTSGNAKEVFRFFLEQNKRILFLPDEHLGANTAHDLGLPDEKTAIYNPSLPGGGMLPGQAEKAQIALWKGYCHVHMFAVDDVRKARAEHPLAKIIVHPETPKEVLRLADAHGSTSQIIKYVENAPSGATIIVGTEINLVKRLAALHKDRVAVYPLRASLCRNMALITEEKLLKTMETWPEENVIRVEPGIMANAARALKRMLEIS
ncbi:MAG: quinolinate synthase NadA [Kiritimatiellae bacterium]|nr:quinolinate synthase NadA [Kiritimatiellia bacterium]